MLNDGIFQFRVIFAHWHMYWFRWRSCTSKQGEKLEESLFVEHSAVYLEIIYPPVSPNAFSPSWLWQKPLVQQQMCENCLHVVRGEQEQEQTGIFLICHVCFSLLSLSALQQLKTMHYLCACDFSSPVSRWRKMSLCTNAWGWWHVF